MKMVVGLGNPGREYAVTRHNVGFMAIDLLFERHGPASKSERRGAWQAEIRLSDEGVVLVKPLTFMNLSGEAVAALVRSYRLGLADLLVVSDDMDLPFGRLRLRERGSAGGHNGLKSIFERLGSQEVSRLRIGVGRPAQGDAIDHVLSQFSGDERHSLPAVLARAADAVEEVIREGVEATMNRVNGGTA